jgi:two-component system, LytTR family, response regulator
MAFKTRPSRRRIVSDVLDGTNAGPAGSRAAQGDTPIRAVIVDDEALARERLRHLLSHEQDFALVGEGATGREAITLVETLSPDLMFLDVAMPELDGVEALTAVPERQRPAVIFVTAHNGYAPKAFDLDALDYLLKPFSVERFHQALGRARRRIVEGRSADDERLLALLSLWRERADRAERLVVKSCDQFTFLSLDEIDWVEASGNYVRVHVGSEAFVIRESMKGMEARLDSRFLRAHRSTIVNADRIRLITIGDDGHPCIVLRDGRCLPAGRQIETRVRNWLDKIPNSFPP